MHMDPLLPGFVAAAFGILLVGAISRRLRQPYVVGYILAGVFLGPHGAGVFEDVASLTRVGEVGVILLLFFIGMEVDVSRLVTNWRISVVGTAAQIVLSVLSIAVIGAVFDWRIQRVILIGFAISLSSTALVLTILRGRRELETEAGQDALGILLVQDVAVVPMLIVIGMFAGGRPQAQQVLLQLLGGAVFVGLLLLLVRGKRITLPFARVLRADHEMQVFGGFLLCFGMSMLSGQLGLSTALGAFAAGLVVSSARETAWLHERLEPFHVLFVAIFFVSIGALLDLPYLVEHWEVLLILVVAALSTNTLINAGILRWLGRPWGASLYVGALLAQVGEFSFVLAAVGKQANIIGDQAYQNVIGLIAGTLVLTPLWLALLRRGRPVLTGAGGR